MTKKDQITLFLIMSGLGIIYWFLFNFLRWDMFDSPGFVGAARQLFGLEGGYNFQSRLSKPLALIIPGALEYVSGVHAKWGFLLQSIIAYYGNGFLIFMIIHKITHHKHMAYCGSIAYLMCQPFAIFSVMILVDAAGWMCNLMIIYYILKYLKNNNAAFRHTIILSTLAAIGLLVKESVVFSFVFLLIYLTCQPESINTKLKTLITALASFTITFIITQIATHYILHDSIIERLLTQQEKRGFVYYDKTNIAQLFRIIDFYWVLVVIGIMGIIQKTGKLVSHREIHAFAFSVALSLILMPLYPFIVDRILFMVAPGLILFASFSYYYLKRYTLPVIIAGGMLNIIVAWLIYRFDTEGALITGSAVYLFIIATVLGWRYRHKLSKLLLHR